MKLAQINRVDYVLKMILSVVCKNWSFTVQFSVVSRRLFVFDLAHGQAAYRFFCDIYIETHLTTISCFAFSRNSNSG